MTNSEGNTEVCGTQDGKAQQLSFDNEPLAALPILVLV